VTTSDRIVAIEIEAGAGASGHSFIDHEKTAAIRDLIGANMFRPNGLTGPFRLRLSSADRNLVIDIFDQGGRSLTQLVLSLLPLKQVVKDYFLVCEAYHAALPQAAPARIEAIDMGRRGLHNEGAEILTERLRGKVEVDFDTARRLFTLICALHLRGKGAR
jgi:uncharacterized protein (UPF0262 family)